MLWLIGMTEEGEDVPHIRKIARSMAKFRSELNGVSQEVEGSDRTLRVDKEDI